VGAVEYGRIRVSRALSRSGLYDLDYAYNPYVGCEHGCLYCYARCFTRGRAAERWGEVVYVKENVVDVLRGEVRRLRRGVVGVSTITDPYQPVEAREGLTRAGIEVLAEAGFRVSVQTKSDLVLRDLDLLARWRDRVDVGLTVTTVRDEVAALIEPRAPPPSRRARALLELSEAGVETWVFLGPIIPGVNDDPGSIRGVVEVARSTGSKLYFDYLRLRPGVEASLRRVLDAFPRALSVTPEWRARVRRLVESICSEVGVECEPSFPRSGQRRLLEFL